MITNLSWKRICAKELNCRQNMSEHNLKSILTWLFLGGHLGTFIALILLTQGGGFDSQEFKTIAGLVLPTFAVYTTTIIKSVITERHKKVGSRRQTSGQFASITLILSIVFTIAIPILIFLKATNFISNFEQFILFLTATETTFAAYLGLIIDALYKATPPDSKPSN